MARRWKGLLPEGSSYSVPTFDFYASVTPVSGIHRPLQAPGRHMVHKYACRQATHTRKIKINIYLLEKRRWQRRSCCCFLLWVWWWVPVTSALRVEASGSDVQGHPWLQIAFEASLYVSLSVSPLSLSLSLSSLCLCAAAVCDYRSPQSLCLSAGY